MSRYKDKVTRGRVSVNKYGSLKVVCEDGHDELLVSGVASPIAVHPRREEAAANGLILAEAINVLHETGLTPRELAEQRDRLLAALKGFISIVSESRGVDGYHLNGNVAEWDEFEEVADAEAAIAACETKDN